MQSLASLVFRGWIVPLFVTATALAAHAEQTPTRPPLRALVVTIVAQDGFLDWLLAEAVAAGRIATLEITTAHVRAIPAHLGDEGFDLVIAHDHARPTRRLAKQGLLVDDRLVFANPQAIIGPADDPAGVARATSFVDALARIAETGACWLLNTHGGLAAIQRPVREAPIRPACVIDEPANAGAAAVRAAAATGAYTLWGFHPYTRGTHPGQAAWVVGDPVLIRPLRAWRVAASPRAEEVSAVLDELAAEAVGTRLATFRLQGDPVNQAWWPPQAAAAGMAPGARRQAR
jgi:tungstate transport system substrate-binding protein